MTVRTPPAPRLAAFGRLWPIFGIQKTPNRRRRAFRGAPWPVRRQDVDAERARLRAGAGGHRPVRAARPVLRALSERAVRGRLRADGEGEPWPTAAIPMDSPYCSCKLRRADGEGQARQAPRGGLQAALAREGGRQRGGAGGADGLHRQDR